MLYRHPNARLLKLYVCALYLPEKSENESAIINSDDNMNIRLVITSRRVSSKALVKAINKGFENSTGNNTSSIDNEIDSLGVLLSGKIRTGDVFDVTNQKERGIVFSIGSKNKHFFSFFFHVVIFSSKFF
mgnify:CR=1 FL=1